MLLRKWLKCIDELVWVPWFKMPKTAKNKEFNGQKCEHRILTSDQANRIISF